MAAKLPPARFYSLVGVLGLFGLGYLIGKVAPLLS